MERRSTFTERHIAPQNYEIFLRCVEEPPDVCHVIA